MLNFKAELSLYINNIALIQRELQLDNDSSRLKDIFDHLDNYYEQINSVKESSADLSIFNGNKKVDTFALSSNVYIHNLDTSGVKNKLLFKLHGLLSEQVESLQTVL